VDQRTGSIRFPISRKQESYFDIASDLRWLQAEGILSVNETCANLLLFLRIEDCSGWLSATMKNILSCLYSF
jgi:hypothetical protein